MASPKRWFCTMASRMVWATKCMVCGSSRKALGKYTSMFYWLRETMSLEGAICCIILFCLDAACETTSRWTIIKENPLNYKNMPCLCSPKSSGQIKISFLLESNLSVGIMENGIIIEWTSDFKKCKNGFSNLLRFSQKRGNVTATFTSNIQRTCNSSLPSLQ